MGRGKKTGRKAKYGIRRKTVKKRMEEAGEAEEAEERRRRVAEENNRECLILDALSFDNLKKETCNL